jgi:reverse gyrase
MQLAQDLFEMGFITYHRTDSIRVSDAGVFVAKEYITEHFGSEFLKIRQYSNIGGAHECIRPTRAIDVEDLKSYLTMNPVLGITPLHLKLYDLIFRQFIASQMKETKVEKGNVLFEITLKDLLLEIEEEVNLSIVEEGFNKILPVEVYAIEDGTYPVQKKVQYRRSEVPFYTHATIIQEMKEKGIGRPSTYAITIEKLIQRRYVIDKKGYLIPTRLGIEVLRLIKKNKKVSPFVSEDYTKELESKMDEVEAGLRDYNAEIGEIFKNLELEKLGELTYTTIEE